jgi:uncharacterized lipoprotein YddW (UPF0748 family)
MEPYMNKFKNILTVCLIVFSLLGAKLVTIEQDFSTEIFDAKSVTVATYEEKDYELRAVWVATAWNLNIGKATNQAAFEIEYKALIDKVKAKNMNAIFFQTRPMNDAWYDSDFAPFSKYASSSEGVPLTWDAMAFMVSYAHQQGIEFHAWMNPYRVITSSDDKNTALAGLSNENFAKINPNLVIAGNLSNNAYPYILNPGEPLVKEYIINVVDEIMDLYDIDGIHYDDYFYPYSGTPSSADALTYQANNPNGLSLEDWRRENVNDVVRGTFEAVEAHNASNSKSIRFGISPFGIWKNGGEGSDTNGMQSYYAQYADSRKWVKEGWVHYINPQVYWQFTTAAAPYANVVNWWVDQVRGTGVDLVIGHSISSATNWSSTEIQNQLLHNAQYPEITGSAFYSASYLDTINVTNVVTNLWQNPTLGTVAESTVESPLVTLSGTKVGEEYKSNVSLSIASTHPAYYRVDLGEWIPYTTPVTFTEQGEFSLHVKATDNLGADSLIQGFSVIINKVNNDIPTITITGNKLGNDYLPGTTVSISASNMDNLWVAINHGSVGPWVKYTEPIVLNETGNYYIQSKTITSEGAESQVSVKSLKVVLDCYQQPTIDLTGIGASKYQSLTVSLTGLTEMQTKINDGAWTTYTTPLEFTEDGDYVLSYRNNDGCQTVYTESFSIDSTAPIAPQIEITGDKTGLYYNTVATATLTAEANETIYYRIHNGVIWSEYQIYIDTLTFNENKTFTLDYYAVDEALNESVVSTERFRMDLPPVEDNPYVIRDGEFVTYYQTDEKVALPTTYQEKEKEVRAVWVATVGNIDVPQMQDETTYKQALTTLLDRVKANRLNTIFFQVRPMNDALYYSELAPHSRYITGTEGVDPGFDILAFMVEEGHKRGIEVHAWLNPYRVSTGTADKATQLALLSDDNFAKQHPEFVIADSQGKLILNPGEPAVRTYLTDVVDELLDNYDIDGIHFDDYFYSYSGMSDSQDAMTFLNNNPDGLPLDDWRRQNVDLLVEGVHNAMTAHNEEETDNDVFGISPFGIWLSGGAAGSNTSTGALQSYKDQYADSRNWVVQGYLDYIMPQLYWQFDHSAAPYADLVDWWAALTEAHDVDLIIGHGFYRYAESSNNWTDENELLEQIRYASQYDSIIGSAFFSYKTFNSNDDEVVSALERLLNHYYKTELVTPWFVEDETPVDPICEEGETLVDGVCVIIPAPVEPNAPLSTDTIIIISSLSLSFVVVGVVFFLSKKRLK